MTTHHDGRSRPCEATAFLSLLALRSCPAGVRSADPEADDKKAGDLPPAAASSDVELVEKTINARKEYETSLKKLWEHYTPHRRQAAREVGGRRTHGLPHAPEAVVQPGRPRRAAAEPRSEDERSRSQRPVQGRDGVQGQGSRQRLHPEHAARGTAPPRDSGEASHFRQDLRRGVSTGRPLRKPSLQAVRPRGTLLRAILPVEEGNRDRRPPPRARPSTTSNSTNAARRSSSTRTCSNTTPTWTASRSPRSASWNSRAGSDNRAATVRDRRVR